MSTFAKFKSKIKSVHNIEELQKIYIEAAEYVENDNLYDKILKECVSREKQLSK